MTSPRTAFECHAAVALAMRRGVLIKQPCEYCDSREVVAHHDDYARPLDVRWMCRKHHRRWHVLHPSDVDWQSGPPMLSVRLSHEENQWLRDYAQREDRSVSWVLRHALRKLVEQNGKSK